MRNDCEPTSFPPPVLLSLVYAPILFCSPRLPYRYNASCAGAGTSAEGERCARCINVLGILAKPLRTVLRQKQKHLMSRFSARLELISNVLSLHGYGAFRRQQYMSASCIVRLISRAYYFLGLL